MPYAASLSEHPVTATATGEVIGSVLDSLGEAPDLAVVFVTPPHAGALEDVAATIRTVLKPKTLIGCAAVSVIGGRREVEGGPAVTLWAGRVGQVAPVRFQVLRVPEGMAVAGWPDPVPFEPRAVLLLADPFSFPADHVLAWVDEHHPGLPVVGGNASAAAGPGGNRLVVDDEVVTAGAVGVILGAPVQVRTVVSQGCRPIGRPYTVTRAEDGWLQEIGGKPPYHRLTDLAEQSDAEDLELLRGGVHLGVVIDEHKETYGRGDFLVRNLQGADRSTGAVAVDHAITAGATVQYLVRDAASADEDLRELLAGQDADAALVFTCNGRGTHLFRTPDHDASVVADLLDDPPVAGFFAAGEFGPIGPRNFVHGFTASIALMRDPAG